MFTFISSSDAIAILLLLLLLLLLLTANRLDAQLEALPKRKMIHKTQSQHNNHYTESIPTPRLQLPSTHLSRIALIHEEMEKNFLICEMLQQKISMWASTLW
jgi:hypothetical protein